MHNTTSRRHPVHRAWADRHHCAEAVSVDYFAVEPICDRGEANVSDAHREGRAGLVSTDDRDERWFEWKDGCYRACEKPARLQGVVFYSMGFDGMTSR
jgi:hypothetical protein